MDQWKYDISNAGSHQTHSSHQSGQYIDSYRNSSNINTTSSSDRVTKSSNVSRIDSNVPMYGYDYHLQKADLLRLDTDYKYPDYNYFQEIAQYWKNNTATKDGIVTMNVPIQIKISEGNAEVMVPTS